MILFLFHFSKSFQSLSTPGYHSVNLKCKEQLDIFLSNGKFDCILIWSHSSDNDAVITVFKENRRHEFKLIGETTAIIKGDKAQISIFSKTTVHAWIIKKDICNMYSLMYTTPQFVKDTLGIKQGIDNICLFFSNYNNQTKISLSFSKSKSSSRINVYSESSPETALSSNLQSLSKQYNQHFFLQITNPNDLINLDYEITGE